MSEEKKSRSKRESYRDDGSAKEYVSSSETLVSTSPVVSSPIRDKTRERSASTRDIPSATINNNSSVKEKDTTPRKSLGSNGTPSIPAIHINNNNVNASPQQSPPKTPAVKDSRLSVDRDQPLSQSGEDKESASRKNSSVSLEPKRSNSQSFKKREVMEIELANESTDSTESPNALTNPLTNPTGQGHEPVSTSPKLSTSPPSLLSQSSPISGNNPNSNNTNTAAEDLSEGSDDPNQSSQRNVRRERKESLLTPGKQLSKKSLGADSYDSGKDSGTEEFYSDDETQGSKGDRSQRLKQETQRLKKEEERLRKEEEILEKKAKEDIKRDKETLKKEREKIKREREEIIRKAKEEEKRKEQKERILQRDAFKDVDLMVEGWMKMRGAFKNWFLRWFVLRPGKLIYYKDEFDKNCQGIIRLKGCEVGERPTKKEGSCFKIYSTKKKTIYSTKGLKGETLPSGLVPLTTDHAIFRVNTDDDRRRWMEAISKSIEYANVAAMQSGKSRQSSDQRHSVEMTSSNYHQSIRIDDIDEEDLDQIEDLNRGEQSQNQYDHTEDNNNNNANPGNTNSNSNTPSQTGTPVITKSNMQTPQSVPPVQLQQQSPKQQSQYQILRPRETRYTPSITADDSNFDNSPLEEELAQDSKALIVSLLKQVRIGMDLSRVVLPTFILEPRSMLEKLSDYLTHTELLNRAAQLSDPQERLIGIVRWYLSGYYIKPKGVKKPYNPILGETFRAMFLDPTTQSKSYFVSEQVSHHPPISAFYASNRREGWIVNGSILFRSKFLGTSAGTILDGFATIYLLNYDEEYEITFPSAYAKGFVFGTLCMELAGQVTVICKSTGYRAEVEFKAKPMFGGDYNVLVAKIKQQKETLFTLSGRWDGKVELTDAQTKKVSTFWEPTSEVRKSKALRHLPIPEQLGRFESHRLWEKVSNAISAGDQHTATDEKTKLEQAQREAAKYREKNEIKYKPKLFAKDTTGVWTYKFMNKNPWSEEEEIEEYEISGIIKTRKKQQESEDSEEEEIIQEMNAENTEEVQDSASSSPPTPLFIAPSPLLNNNSNSNLLPTPSSQTVPPSDRTNKRAIMAASPDNNNHNNSNNILSIPSSTAVIPPQAVEIDDGALKEWKGSLESRIYKLEKDILPLHHKKLEVEEKILKTKGGVSKVSFYVVGLLLLAVCYYVYLLQLRISALEGQLPPNTTGAAKLPSGNSRTEL